MAFNAFPFADSTFGHCLAIGATFLVLLMVAVLIDWVIRQCEARGVSPSLVRVLHFIAQALVVVDGALILIDACSGVVQRLS